MSFSSFHHINNGYYPPRPLLPSPSPSSTTPAFPMFRNEPQTTPLHDILERYKDDIDTLRLILASKTAEDNRRAEEERTRAERYRLESKRMELEISRRSYATPSPVENGRPHHLPVPILSVPIPPERRLPPMKRRKSETRAPVPSVDMPKLDHDTVMEKLRNKIHTRQELKRRNSESPTTPISATMTASPLTSPRTDKQISVDMSKVKMEQMSSSESDSPVTSSHSKDVSRSPPTTLPVVEKDKSLGQSPSDQQDKSTSPPTHDSTTDNSKQT